MPKDDELLRSITTFPKLVKYLRDELQWPIEETSFEDLTFDYEAEELGLDPKTAVKVRSIKQLRPLTAGQPWGVFFVEFERKHLPVVVMRRILSALALKKRASAGKSDQAAWRASDLLFISSFGEEGGRGITFAHFAPDEQGHDLPALKVLGWDGDDTKLHTQAVAESLASSLTWPLNARDINAWRTQWSSAFVLANREVVTTSRELSIQLAKLAVGIRERAKALLSSESDRGPLRKLHKAFKEALLHDLTQDGFADMYAQTVAYGLLAARLENPDSPTPLTASALADMIPATSPFLKGLLSTFLKIGGRKGYLDFDELGIGDVVDLLRNAKMKAVLLDFGDLKPDEDPVLHFYELFLDGYDHAQKMQRGVFYTPKPVVHYIVHSVDETLRTEFGLKDGLADTTTWGEMAGRCPDVVIPDTVRADSPFVQVLDPATGTATFLVEVVDVIYGTMTAKWRGQGKTKSEIDTLWNEYVPLHLLPRLCGFEILVAPYTIAHIKFGLKLRETGYHFGSTHRSRIYLTNTLEDPAEFSDPLGLLLPALAEEARAVATVKRMVKPTVIIGNPPYSAVSSNKGEWITGLVDDYKRVDGNPLGEKKLVLGDDYVKFIRYAQWRIDRTGLGVLGFVTNHSYLDNPTFRGMRQALLSSFGRLRILNLHGNSLRKETCPDGSKDENVFDIRVGVAVLWATRSPGLSDGVHYADLWGDRNSKYALLNDTKTVARQGRRVHPRTPMYAFQPEDAQVGDEYREYVGLTDVFVDRSSGIYTRKDDFCIAFERQTIWDRVTSLASMNERDARAVFRLGADKENWSVSRAQTDVRKSGPNRNDVDEILYRPFDIRYTYFTGSSSGWHSRPGGTAMRAMRRGNVGLCVLRESSLNGGFSQALASSCLVDARTLLTSRGTTYVFPLQREQPDTQRGDKLLEGSTVKSGDYNVQPALIAALRQSYGPSGTPERVFAYIYSVLYSPGYRTRYAEFLKTDFPRIPFAKDRDAFIKLAKLGQQLIDLHLMCSPELDNPVSRFCGNGDSAVARVEYDADLGHVSINATRYFDGITPDLWRCQIGGYPVLMKWLKDRGPKGGQAGRVLSPDDILHYRKIVTAIAKTIELQVEIDRVIAAAGGFPTAFQ